MANAGVPKGKSNEGMGVDGGDGGKVNQYAFSKKNVNGIPSGQTPGIDTGDGRLSMNALPSNARVVKPAKSNLMTGMSQSRGPGGAK